MRPHLVCAGESKKPCIGGLQFIYAEQVHASLLYQLAVLGLGCPSSCSGVPTSAPPLPLPHSRRDLDINRPGTVLNAKTLRCPVMLVVGDNAPAEDGVVECNSKLDPTTTTFLKMADSGGLPQVTQPGKLTEAFKYFLQGMGYMPSASMTRLARSRTASLTSASSVDGSRPQACTHSESSEGLGQVNHTMEVSC